MRLTRHQPPDAHQDAFFGVTPVLRVVRRSDGRVIARAVTDGHGAYWLTGAEVGAVDLTAVKRAINKDLAVLRVV
jgi:hypothetical protein